MAEHMQTV